MDVYGAHVPVSKWTAVVLIVGVASSSLLWRPLARLHGWRPRWTLTTLLSVTVVLSLTLAPDADGRAAGARACIPVHASTLELVVSQTGGGLVGDLLNVLLTLPMTLSLVLATRRVWPSLVSAPLLSLCIELTQTMIPGRVCALSDLVSNTVGGLLGMAFGGLLHWKMTRQARRPTRAAGRPGRRASAGR